MKLAGKRGVIYDRRGKRLAESVLFPSLALNPRRILVRNRSKLAADLAGVLSLDKAVVQKKLWVDRFYVRIKRHLTPKEFQAVKAIAEKYPKDFKVAMKFVYESKRVYPFKNLASHILGYTDRDGKGLAGVERYYQPILKGSDKFLCVAQDSRGRLLLQPDTFRASKARWGANVVLTLDSSIQHYTEKALAKAVLTHKAKRGIAVVMSPRTGDVLAMAVYPDFDPNVFRKTKVQLRNNWAVVGPYEPGSTMKPITLAVARHLNKLRWSERINCENGRMRIGRRTIKDDHPKGLLTPLEVIKYSSNICTAKVAFRLGKRTLYKYLRDFGFGQRTNVGLPSETRGLLSKPRYWANISLANIAFGQGIGVTPLQLTAAINTIAAGGIYRRPRLYRRLFDRYGKTFLKFEPDPGRRVISSASARAMTRMMESVVQRGGTALRANIKGISVAGKTGTAQKARPRSQGGGYGKGRIGSFVGFLPAKNPRLTILVVIDEPQGSKYGGVVAAPAWKEIAQASLSHVGYLQLNDFQVKVFPKKTKTTTVSNSKAKPLPRLKGLSLKKAQEVAKKWKLTLQVIGKKGTVRFQRPAAGKPIPGDRKVTLIVTAP
jgi:cell division protein FtsI (penicillin-binding protein 3)